MPKPMWVLLPLLAAAALLAWRLLRRRVPSRLGLNVAFSLLLLGYLATTAGLGIFWVANQQLPVFDWHYLFGYATLLLVLVHLVFNWRVVWRYLTRPRRARAAASLSVAAEADSRAPAEASAPATTATATPTPSAWTTAATPAVGAARMRRRSLGVALGLLGALGGYGLGLRHGRQSMPLQARDASARRPGATAAAPHEAAGESAAPGPDNAPLAQVERFHRLSANSRAGVLRAPGIDWGDAPPPFKPQTAAGRVALPRPTPAAPAAPAGTATLQVLATLLWHTVGITRDGATLALRAAPSSGALFPTELYVAALAVDALAPGLWHYDVRAQALSPVAAGADAAAAVAAAAGHDPASAPAWIVATAVFRRSGHKYRERCYRYVLADLGHALENLHVAAVALGWQAQFMMRFDEAQAAQALRLDAHEEGVLALLALRRGDAAPLEAAALAWQPAAPLREQDTPLGLTGAMHAASSLRAVPASEPPSRAGARPLQPPAQAPAQASGGAAADALARPPARTPGQTPAQTPGQTPGQTSGQTPAQTPDRTPPAAARTPARTLAEGQAPATERPAPPARAAVAGAIVLAEAAPTHADPLRLIATRRSQRRFPDPALALPALSGVLAALFAPPLLLPPQDLMVHLVAQAVDGLAPGAYRYEPQRHALLPSRAATATSALRRAARGAALDQDVIGDAAVVFVLALQRGMLLDAAVGPARAYRHALLQAGCLGERIYLEAGARGLRCCAVGAFYDDEAAALVAADPAREWVLHFAALG